eukprot:Opistho-1_new@86845
MPLSGPAGPTRRGLTKGEGPLIGSGSGLGIGIGCEQPPLPATRIANHVRAPVEDHRRSIARAIGGPGRQAGSVGCSGPGEGDETVLHGSTDGTRVGSGRRSRQRSEHEGDVERMERTARGFRRRYEVELIDECRMTGSCECLRLLQHRPPAAPIAGRGEEDVGGRICRKAAAIFGDHPIDRCLHRQFSRDLRANRVPAERPHLGTLGIEIGARLVARSAQYPCDLTRCRRCIRAERMTGHVSAIEDRPHVNGGVLERVARAKRFQQLFDREGQQRREVLRRYLQRREICPRALRRALRTGHRHLLPAHGRGAMEQAARLRHRHQRRDLGAAARLTEHRHPRGIAAKLRDIRTHPSERQDKVELAVVAAVREAPVERSEIEVAESIEAVVDRDQHHALPRQRRAVILGIGNAAVRVRSTMDIDHHRQLRARVGVWRPDVEEQAILGLRPVLATLRTGGAETVGTDRVARRRNPGNATKAFRTTIADATKTGETVDTLADKTTGRTGHLCRARCLRKDAPAKQHRRPGQEGTAGEHQPMSSGASCNQVSRQAPSRRPPVLNQGSNGIGARPGGLSNRVSPRSSTSGTPSKRSVSFSL